MRKEFQDHNSIDSEVFCDECGSPDNKIYQRKGFDICTDCLEECPECGAYIHDGNGWIGSTCTECFVAEMEENNL